MMAKSTNISYQILFQPLMRGPDIYLTILNIFISFEEVETLILQDY